MSNGRSRGNDHDSHADPSARGAHVGDANESGEIDPTGVRSILAGLRDPGPMPQDLVERISASLAAEEARRAARSDDYSSTVASLDSARERARMRHRLPSIAIAASVVVLAGAVVLGMLALNSRGSLSYSAADSAAGSATHLAPGARAESGGGSIAGDDSGSDTADDGGADVASDAAASDESLAGEDSDEMGSFSTDEDTPVAAAARLVTSGAAVSSGNLAQHARAVRDGEINTSDSAAELSASASLVNTAAGAADCLAVATAERPGETWAAGGTDDHRIAAIDFVSFDNQDAAVIVVTDEPLADGAEAAGAGATAYVVRPDCGLTPPELLTDPVSLNR